ncbi:MAG: hypothetical protein EOO38_16775 [Cytophagaceae bacterium]|nr:MAG: hypothetical protein EOO38_16775 [Cytophagaceae bacterium]
MAISPEPLHEGHPSAAQSSCTCSREVESKKSCKRTIKATSSSKLAISLDSKIAADQQLSENRRLTVRSYQKKTLVDLREVSTKLY